MGTGYIHDCTGTTRNHKIEILTQWTPLLTVLSLGHINVKIEYMYGLVRPGIYCDLIKPDIIYSRVFRNGVTQLHFQSLSNDSNPQRKLVVMHKFKTTPDSKEKIDSYSSIYEYATRLPPLPPTNPACQFTTADNKNCNMAGSASRCYL